MITSMDVNVNAIFRFNFLQASPRLVLCCVSYELLSRPIFEKPNIEVSVYENAEVGKSLETFKATDPDQGGKSKVSFKIDRTSDKKRQFVVNQDGTVTIQRTLDREDTPRHQVYNCITKTHTLLSESGAMRENTKDNLGRLICVG